MDKEKIHKFELKAEAIKGLAAIAEYIVANENVNKEIVGALHTLQDWISNNE